MELDTMTDVDWNVIVAFAENDMNSQRTADYLYMHRNNVRYHLMKVYRLTGLDPKKFCDLVKLLYIFNQKGGVKNG